MAETREVCPECDNERSTDSGTSLCAKCGGDGRTFSKYPRALFTDDGTDECQKCGGTGKQKERDDGAG